MVIVQQGHAGTRRLEDGCLFGIPRAVAEFVQACLFRDVDEYDWGVVHKSSRRDRAGHGIFHGGVRSTRGNSRGFRFFRLTILRSEEHTSELQSRSDLVCRLLLEKKNI